MIKHVIELPVTTKELFSLDEYSSVDECIASSAAVALNNHDKLVETVKTLLEVMGSADARDYANAVRSARELIDGLEE